MFKLKIVIPCYKNDIFFTRICVASIRYYYPTVPIYLIKDYIRGNFPTWDLEKYFRAKIINLGIKKYGWATSKIHLLLAGGEIGDKLLVLDSDTVFIGKAIDNFQNYLDKSDFIVSPEYKSKPGHSNFRRIYYDFNWFKKLYPKFEFPGYTFNTGQIVITPGVLKKSDIKRFIQFEKFPFWKRGVKSKFKSRDQAILNVLLPLKSQLGEVVLTKNKFMLWSKDAFVSKKLTLNDVKKGKYSKVIHWAGELIGGRKRDNLSRNDILSFFEDIYYSKIPLGRFLRKFRK